MGIFDGLRQAWPLGREAAPLKTRQTDEFADLVLLELKSVSADAIRSALEERENRYMRSILEDSFFGLDSLVITPRDREIARRFEEFLSTHESIDPDFRRTFFRQVIQPEYRSTRGSLVRVGPDFAATVQLGADSLDPTTDEEGFQITLRGRRLLFDAVASLSGPFRRERSTATRGHEPVGRQSEPGPPAASAFPGAEPVMSGANSSISAEGAAASKSVFVRLTDARGVSQHQVEVPAVLGRNPTSWTPPAGWNTLRIDATYTSRQQLVVFDLLGTVHYALASGSSLSACRTDGVVLEHAKHYPLLPQDRVMLHIGIPPDQGPTQPPLGPASEFAVLEISLEPATATSSGTPRPRAIP